MAGKHSADDDFNPYRHQSNRQNEENIKRNSKENYVAENYNKTRRATKNNRGNSKIASYRHVKKGVLIWRKKEKQVKKIEEH